MATIHTKQAKLSDINNSQFVNTTSPDTMAELAGRRGFKKHLTLNGVSLMLIYKGINLSLSRDGNGNLRLHDSTSFYGISAPWSNAKLEPVIRMSYWLGHGLPVVRAFAQSDDAAIRQMKNYLLKIERYQLGVSE